MAKSVRLGPFSGAITGVDDAAIPPGNASATLNADTPDGLIRPRKGFRTVLAAQAAFAGARCLRHLMGFTSAYASVEELVSVEKLGATVRPYATNPATWTRAELTNGATHLSLTDSEWDAIATGDNAYFFNATDGLYRHILGTAASFTPLVKPAAPTTLLTYTNRAPSPAGFVDDFMFATLDPTDAGDVVVDGTVAKNVGSTNTFGILNIAHTGTGAAWFEVILNAGGGPGKRDWKNRDAVGFTLKPHSATKFKLNATSIVATITNDAGTPVVLPQTSIEITDLGVDGYYCMAWFERKTRTDWGDGAGAGKVTKIKVAYTVDQNSGAGLDTNLSISYIDAYGVRWVPMDLEGNSAGVVTVGYSYVNSTTGMESDIGGAIDIPFAALIQEDPTGYAHGALIQFTHVACAVAGVDKVRYHVKDQDGYWHQVTEQNDTTLTYVCAVSYNELLVIAVSNIKAFDTVRSLVGAFPFRGAICWLYAGGKENLKYSRISDAEAQSSENDNKLIDTDRGATFSMSENFDDEPLGGWGFGDAVVAIGSRGVYWQLGERPAYLSPPAKIEGAPGCAGRHAFAPWRDDRGSSSLIWLATDGELWSAHVDPSGGTSSACVSATQRGSIKQFLATDTGLSLGGAMVFAHEASESLWIVLGARAVVLRQKAINDGKRWWAYYEYQLTSILRVSSSEKRGLVWMDSAGKLQEVEWNSASAVAIDGINRDGGQPMPDGYWRTKTFQPGPSRVDQLRAVGIVDGAQIRVESDRLDEYYTKGPRQLVRTSPIQQGRSHRFTIPITELTAAIEGFEFDVLPAGERRGA
jgi:hypothetical protein